MVATAAPPWRLGEWAAVGSESHVRFRRKNAAARHRKGYTPQGFAEKVFHLHIRHPCDWDEIVFRDFLRQNPAKAQEYARLKTSLQKRFEHDRDAYTEAKSDFIRAF